jgi:hypothetical protein
LSKPRVKYSSLVYAEVGHCALLRPIDHPSYFVSNEKVARTSKVLSYNRDTGRIETENTVYIPQQSRI